MARRRGGRARFNWVYADRRRWAAVRAKVLERDGWTCRRPGCGRYANIAHHDPPLHVDAGDPYNPDKIYAICRGCHADVHADLREPSKVGGRDDWRAAMRSFMRRRA